MAKRGQKLGNLLLPYADHPDSMTAWLSRHLTWLGARNYSAHTIRHRRQSIGLFIVWCATRSLLSPAEITKPILERYRRYLFHYRKEDGKPLSFGTQSSRLVPLRAFFKWLTRENVIVSNPASELELPRREYRLPRAVLTVTEAERILGEPDVTEPLGLRDRAILEVLYSTGMRRMEAVALRVNHIDLERGTAMIVQGKGKKDRMVPVGGRALRWVQAYLDSARPALVVPPDEGILFLTTLGDSITPDRLSQLVSRYVRNADIQKSGSCHLFRHTMATLMLEGGADIRFIQQMLGHESLETTQLYTRVSILKLKEVHTATHPAAEGRRFSWSAK